MKIDNEKPLLATSEAPVALAHPVYARALVKVAEGSSHLHLDVGAGTGANAVFATRFGLKSIAVEYDPDYVQAITVPSIRSTADSLPFRAGTFDVVTIIHVLEHLPLYRQTISEIRRSLKPGAHIIIEVPSKYSLQELLNFLYTRIVLNEERKHLGHCNFFSYWSLRQLLEDEGFVVEQERIGGGLFSSTARSTVDLFLRIAVKGLLHRGKSHIEDDDNIGRLHRRLNWLYEPLRELDERVNQWTPVFADVIGFVCRRTADTGQNQSGDHA